MSPNLATIALKRYYAKGSSASGCVCDFFKITHKWGIKTYYYQPSRDDAYEAQYLAAKYGYGPRVGECFEITLDNKLYCYVTEVAEPLDDELVRYKELYEQNIIEYTEYNRVYNEVESRFREEIDELNAKMIEDIDFDNHDDHLFNYGLIDGKVVCIDFGND